MVTDLEGVQTADSIRRLSTFAVEELKRRFASWQHPSADTAFCLNLGDDGFDRRIWLLDELLSRPPQGKEFEAFPVRLETIDRALRGAFQDLGAKFDGWRGLLTFVEPFIAAAVCLLDPGQYLDYLGSKTGPKKGLQSLSSIARVAADLGLLPLPPGDVMQPPGKRETPYRSSFGWAIWDVGQLRNKSTHTAPILDGKIVDICLVVVLGVVHHNFEQLAKAAGSGCRTGPLPIRPLDPTIKLWVTELPNDWLGCPGEIALVAADDQSQKSIDLDTRSDLIVHVDRQWLDHPGRMVPELDRSLLRVDHPRCVALTHWPGDIAKASPFDEVARWVRASKLPTVVVADPPVVRPGPSAPAHLSGSPDQTIDLGVIPGLDRAPYLLLVETADPDSLFQALRGAEASVPVSAPRRRWLAIDTAKIPTSVNPLDAARDGDIEWLKAFHDSAAVGLFLPLISGAALQQVAQFLRTHHGAARVVTSASRAWLSELQFALGQIPILGCAHASDIGRQFAPAGIATLLRRNDVDLMSWCTAACVLNTHLQPPPGELQGQLIKLQRTEPDDDLVAHILAGQPPDLSPTLKSLPEEASRQLISFLARGIPAWAPLVAGAAASIPSLAQDGLEEVRLAEGSVADAAAMRWLISASRNSPLGIERAKGCLSPPSDAAASQRLQRVLLRRVACAALRLADGHGVQAAEDFKQLARDLADALDHDARAVILASAGGETDLRPTDSAVRLASRCGSGASALLERWLLPWTPADDGVGAAMQPGWSDHMLWAAVQSQPPDRQAQTLMVRRPLLGLALGLPALPAAKDPAARPTTTQLEEARLGIPRPWE